MAYKPGNVIPLYVLENIILQRAGAFRVGLSGNIAQRQIWKCKDGFVAFIITGGQLGRRSRLSLKEWIKDEEKADRSLQNIDWDTFDMKELSQEKMDQIERGIEKIFATKTKVELYKRAFEDDIWLYPVSTVSDLLGDPQLHARGYWVDIEHPELATAITYPGNFFKSSQTSGAIGPRAPLPGEHNTQVYQDILGFSLDTIGSLSEATVI